MNDWSDSDDDQHPVIAPVASAIISYTSAIIIIANTIAGAVIYSHPLVRDATSTASSGASWGLVAGIITARSPTLGGILNALWFGLPAATIIAHNVHASA